MATLNFLCGHCNKLMAVGDHLLGKQVRCPHCQQVVRAPEGATAPFVQPAAGPAPAPPALSPPLDENTAASWAPASSVGEGKDLSFTLPRLREEDSIFAPPEESDDLFGAAPEGPVLEMPPEPAPVPNLEIPGGPGTLPYTGPVDVTGAYFPPDDLVPVDLPANGPGAWPGASTTGLMAAPPDAPPPPAAPPPPIRGARESSQLTATLLIFLIPYCIFITVVAIVLYVRASRAYAPLEILPDLPAERPGATHKGPSSMIFQRVDPETALAAKLRVPLKQAIQLGDLEVVPEKIEQRHITFCTENSGRDPVPSENEALVLTMKLRNISEDVYFVPTDPAFETRWSEGEPPGSRPYTFLEVGAKKFFGGPIKWTQRPNRDPGNWREEDPREYVKGQEDDGKVLKPGEQRSTILCTDPENLDVIPAVRAYRGQMLWRIRLRRGLVQVGDREISTSGVIGVLFTAKDVQ